MLSWFTRLARHVAAYSAYVATALVAAWSVAHALAAVPIPAPRPFLKTAWSSL